MVEQLYHNPDIYRIYVPLPDNPLKYLNCYILVSDGETLIIDTGFNRPECKQALMSCKWILPIQSFFSPIFTEITAASQKN